MASTGATSEVAGNFSTWWCRRPDGSGEANGLNSVIMDDGPVWKVLFSNPDELDLTEADVIRAWR